MPTIKLRRPRRRPPRSVGGGISITKQRSEWLPLSRPLRLLLTIAAAVLLPCCCRGAAAAQDTAPHRVTIIGSGNFGSAVARLLGRNVLALPHLFAPDVRMWVFEEMVRAHALL